MATSIAETPTTESAASTKAAIIAAWIVMLSVSMLPDVILREVFHASGAWLIAAKFGVLTGAIAVGFSGPALRRLRGFGTILMVLLGAGLASARIGTSALWNEWFPRDGFAGGMFSEQLLRMAVTVVMIGMLFLLKRNRKEFFLAVAPGKMAQPIWWLPIKRPVAWSVIAPIVAVAVSLGTLLFLVVAARPSQSFMLRAFAALPAVLIFATMNSFSEEMSYRASLIATSMEAVGERQAIWISAAYFGLAHYYGVPYGPVGVLMAGFLGLVLGEVMLRSRGLLWPWLIHFLQDVMIFSFLAAGSVAVGGK